MNRAVEEFLDQNYEKAVHFTSSDGIITYTCSYKIGIFMFGDVIESAIAQGLTPEEVKEKIKEHDALMNYGWANIMQASTNQISNTE